MRYIIGAILLLIALIIIGLIWRKKVYDEVDQLEGWKLDIMNRRVTEELSKIKSLNLSGETQEKFETWRDRWDQILTKELPELEEDLFDAEEAADRYQMKRVKVVLTYTEKKLEDIEEDIKVMYGELDNLLDSEKYSRIEIEAIEPELKELSKTLIHNRHQYGKAVHVFEGRIEDLKNQLLEYERMTDCGDYLEANALVQSLRDCLSVLQEDISQFPERYKKSQTMLPEQLDELLSGITEMEAEGYRISHLEFKSEIHKYKEKLTMCVSQLEQGDQQEVDEYIADIETNVQDMYQTLEKEAIAHKFVQQCYEPYKNQLDELDYLLAETEQEIQELQYTYQFKDEDLEMYSGLKKWLSQLKKWFENFSHERQDGNTPFTLLRDELEQTKQQLEELYDKHKTFHQEIQTLRKDEFDAKERVFKMEHLLIDTHRRLKRSNIPGIPSFIYDEMKEASEQLDDAFMNLEKQPLDMALVNSSLEAAINRTEQLYEDANELMEQAQLAERIIQYGNRYRSQYPLLAAKLVEAESEFRSFQYEAAIEQATEAVQEIDPDAISRLGASEQVSV